MPSTYSNLKIQLMATGENATTWGNVTNVNLGTAIEEAIVGSADVTFASGNVTLSLTDTNASQTARNMRLRCTGTTGGSTRDLVVPSIEKPYIVQNDCADSVVVKTSAGTGITVPAGKTMWVYSDGTNVVDAVTHLSSLTLGTALAVAQGGTGANTASAARTALGLGTVATQNSSSVSITGGDVSGVNLSSSNVTITGGSITGITDLAIADGGTGSSTASGARTNLGLGTISTQNANSVSITGGSITGITDLAIADGGTGASTASGARSGLGAAASGANTDITSLNPTGGLQVGSPTGGARGTGTLNATGLFVNGVAVGTSSGSVTSVNASGGTTGLTFSGGPITTSGTLTLSGTLDLDNGGTGSTTASGARTALGLGTIATQNSNAVSITGGTLTGVNVSSSNVTITGGSITGITDLAIADGGTGASTAANARTNLGLGTLATASSVNLASEVTGTLAIANGGTGANTAAAALTALGALGVDASALTGNGFIELSNGLYIMWGSFTAAGNGSTTFNYSTISGSISLTSFSRSITSGGPSGGGDNPPHTTACTTTGFTVYNAFSSSVTTFFIAVGV